MCVGETAQVERAIHLELTLFGYLNAYNFFKNTKYCPTCIAKVLAYLILRGTLEEVEAGIFRYKQYPHLNTREKLLLFAAADEELDDERLRQATERIKALIKEGRKA